MKKLLSILLCFVLLVCVSTFFGTAESTDDLLNVLEYETLADGTVKITRYDSLNPTFDIPSQIDGKDVTVIGKKAFKECHSLKGITIPDTVTSIENQAFDKCEKLASVALGNSVKSLGYRAFADCKVLKTINLPQSLESIGNNCFIRCFELNSVTIPQSVMTIGNYAFSDCTGLTELTLENGEFIVGEYAFGWCLKLTEITLGDKVKELKNNAFYACDNVSKFTIESDSCAIYDCATTLPDDATVYAYNNSTAYEYATKYSKAFVALDKSDLLLGDVDLDGTVSVLDATLIQMHLVSQSTICEHGLKNADTDKDGNISIMDATQIQRLIAQIIYSF